MNRSLNRRELIRQGLTAGALLALPGRALAQAVDPLAAEFDQAFGGAAQAPVAPVEAVPPAPVYDPAYQRRLAGSG